MPSVTVIIVGNEIGATRTGLSAFHFALMTFEKGTNPFILHPSMGEL